MGAMGIEGLLNGRNIVTDAQYRHQLQQSMQMQNHSAFVMNHSPPLQHHHQHSMSQPNSMSFAMTTPQHQQMIPSSYMPQLHHTNNLASMESSESRPRTEPAPKAFACGTCQKGFARRSDLARHERIHSGVRPHACDFPGCGKEFIQRSALTVHTRVHTGEKPHMCERCGKPFSDSSSLARHRRIHSGKRPYKCPYANCQKTFTRRTTLTRHQNHHTGTVEQAQAETNAKLSLTQAEGQPQSANSNYSDVVSRNSTASPIEALSMSPAQELTAIQNMSQTIPQSLSHTISKQNSAYGYMPQQNQSMLQMRNAYQPTPDRSSHTLHSSTGSAYAGSSHMRPAITSHRSGFGPPQPMEPAPRGIEGSGSSPHMSGAMGWGSPNNVGMPSPTVMDPYGSAYQDPAFTNQSLYYPGSNMRQPQSTEPEEFGLRPARQILSHHMNTGNMHAANWHLPLNMHHEVKQEGGFA